MNKRRSTGEARARERTAGSAFGLPRARVANVSRVDNEILIAEWFSRLLRPVRVSARSLRLRATTGKISSRARTNGIALSEQRPRRGIFRRKEGFGSGKRGSHRVDEYVADA